MAFSDALRLLRSHANANTVLAQQRLYRSYAEAVRTITQFVRDGALSGSRARALERQLKESLQTFTFQAERIIGAGVIGMVNTVVAEHRAEVGRLLSNAGIARTPRWDRVAGRTRFALNEARGGTDLRSLLRFRMERSSLRTVDNLINAALDTDLNSRVLSQQLAVVMTRNDPAILTQLDGPTRLIVKDGVEAIAEGDELAAEAYKVVRSAEGFASILHDARRIAVSEINNSLRESNTAAMIEGGIVEAARWTLNGRHEGLPSSPDECDDLAEADDYGFGPGFYPLDAWPDAPHPWCGCYQGAVHYSAENTWDEEVPAPDDSETE